MHLASKTTDKTYSTFTPRAILVTFNNQNLKQKAFELTFSVSEWWKNELLTAVWDIPLTISKNRE